MIISFIGAPCVGKGVLIKRVHERLLDQARVGLVSTSDIVKSLLTDTDVETMRGGALFPRETELRDALYQSIERQYAMGAEAVLLDGFPRFDDQVVWMVQTFYDRPLQVFQVQAPSELHLLQRARARARDQFDTDPMLFGRRVVLQRQLLSGAEARILQYALRYSTIINDDLERATLDALSRIKIPKE